VVLAYHAQIRQIKIGLQAQETQDDKERLKLAFSNAISGLKTGLQIIKGVTGGVGLGPPGLQAGLSALLLVLDAIQVSL
jgi:hypothetical protein